MEVVEFRDAKTVPDKIYEYTSAIRDGCVPIVIDNGTCMSRVGWSINKQPLLQFKNLIAKPRRERSKKDTVEVTQAPQLQVGNDIVNIEALRFQSPALGPAFIRFYLEKTLVESKIPIPPTTVLTCSRNWNNKT